MQQDDLKKKKKINFQVAMSNHKIFIEVNI